MEELCGNGLDDDALGGDAVCAGLDGDDDGYTTTDCDDTNRYIYPGVYTTSGCSGGEYRQCQSGGTYTACTATTLAEGTRNYYFDFVSGNNANACSFASPCKDALKFAYFTDSNDSERPASPITPTGGDVFYFMDGTYTTIYGDTSFGRQFLMLRNFNGTSGAKITIKAYPGEAPVFDPNCDSGNPCSSIYALDSDYWIVDGIDMTGAYNGEGMCIKLQSDNWQVRNIHCYENHGSEDDNNAGISVAGNNNEIHHNRIHDNYETGAASGGQDLNDVQIVLFGSSGNYIHHNIIYNTASDTDANSGAACIKYKHGANTGTFEVAYNVLWNCKHVAIGTGTFASNIHHNRIWDSAFAFGVKDWGGPTYHNDELIEFNTVKNSLLLDYLASSDYVAIGDLTVRKNIFIDNAVSYGNENAVIVESTYQSDAHYALVHSPETFVVDQNCYYNSAGGAIKFCDHCVNNGGSYGNNGSLYTFSGWQTRGFDASSFSENPSVDSSHRATSTNCDDWGWSLVAGGGGTTTTTSTTTSTVMASSDPDRKTLFNDNTLFDDLYEALF